MPEGYFLSSDSVPTGPGLENFILGFFFFCHFRGINVFLPILDVLGNFGHFIGFMVFWSFERFQGYFSILLGFWGIFWGDFVCILA